nr:putative reverse transcriptase domain-containing protein [Tanacetum cinerariifolium]
RRSTQLRPTLFHLHLHSVSRLGYFSDPSRRHCSSLKSRLRALPPILLIPLPAASPPLQLLSFDRRADRPDVTLPPRKRLNIVHCPRYEAGESSVAAAAARPMKGRRADYGFVDSVEAEIRQRRAEDIGYGIRDTWIDLIDVAEEEALTTLEGVNTRITELAAVQEQDTQDMYRVMEDTQGRQREIFQRVKALVDDSQYHYETGRLVDQEARFSREAWAHSMGLGSAVHFELQGYMTHTWARSERFRLESRLVQVLLRVPVVVLRFILKMAPEKAAPKRTTRLNLGATPNPNSAPSTTTITVTNAQLQAMIDQGVNIALAARDANRTGNDSHTSGTGALTWWNSHVRIVGNDASYVMTWIELKKKMADKYCQRNEMKKIETEF